MPELPEVETTRRCIAPVLEQATIIAVRVELNRMLRRQPNPGDFVKRLRGARIETVGRHGKFLLTTLRGVADGSSGCAARLPVASGNTAAPGEVRPDGLRQSVRIHGGDIIWVTHLGMSGRISLMQAGEPVAKYSHVIVTLDSGVEFRFIDPRTFGFVAAYTPQELDESSIADLGRDALTDLPRSPALQALLAGRSASIKALLLDQRIIAGIGNIYADESLHRAAISPHRPGGSLTSDEISALRKAIKDTLRQALKWGGTSLDDLAYLLPDGRAGEYINRLRAYGREGEHCRRCGTQLIRDVIRGRSSFWCPGCQVGSRA